MIFRQGPFSVVHESWAHALWLRLFYLRRLVGWLRTTLLRESTKVLANPEPPPSNLRHCELDEQAGNFFADSHLNLRPLSPEDVFALTFLKSGEPSSIPPFRPNYKGAHMADWCVQVAPDFETRRRDFVAEPR